MAPWRYFLISCCDFTSKYCIFHCHNYLQFIIMTIIIVIIISIIIIIIIFWSLRLVSLRNELIHQFSDLYLHISWMASPFWYSKELQRAEFQKSILGHKFLLECLTNLKSMPESNITIPLILMWSVHKEIHAHSKKPPWHNQT